MTEFLVSVAALVISLACVLFFPSPRENRETKESNNEKVEISSHFHAGRGGKEVEPAGFYDLNKIREDLTKES